MRGANLRTQGASDACGEELTRDGARAQTGDSCEIDRAWPIVAIARTRLSPNAHASVDS
ncbi:MAG TPA: hypothetical protein VF331_22075 [Polyangiales bacterium]